MPPERWQEIERLYHAALERAPAQRGAFLAEACNSDNGLRREVESLLQQETSSSGSPMERPVLEGAAELRDSPTVRQLALGAQLGPYKIEALLGAGGMGEVYRAVDTRLRRTVALKVLARERTADHEHRRRFLEEAKAASALNHPNIVVLHDISRDSGTDFLVMEYVQGQTLESLIGAEGLPFDRVTEYGAQIGSALAAAHSAGIVHRDIKPANIMITQDNAKTLALDTEHADAFCARGQLLWTPPHGFQNRPALRSLNSALKLNPGCHQAQIWRGLIFFHVGLYAEARQGLEEALAVHPEDTRTMVFLAQTALYRGDYEEAYELERRALALDPAGVWQNLFFPTIPLYLGRPSEAAEALRKAGQMVPGEATLASVEGLIAAHEGDFRRAEQLIDTAVESKKTLLHTHHLWHNAASGYAMCGKPDKAIKWLRECADMGLPNYLLFGSDPHLRGLHNRPEFLALMSDLRREHDTYREEFGLAGGNHFV